MQLEEGNIIKNSENYMFQKVVSQCKFENKYNKLKTSQNFIIWDYDNVITDIQYKVQKNKNWLNELDFDKYGYIQEIKQSLRILKDYHSVKECIHKEKHQFYFTNQAININKFVDQELENLKEKGISDSKLQELISIYYQDCQEIILINQIIQLGIDGKKPNIIFPNILFQTADSIINQSQRLLYDVEQIKQKLEQKKVLDLTKLTIISIKEDKLQQKFNKISENLQIINFYYNNSNQITHQNNNQNNVYDIFIGPNDQNQINSFKIVGEIYITYKYFIKSLIQKHKPKIIFLIIEINQTFNIETFFLKKLIYQLNKISNDQLMILPIFSNLKKEDQQRKIICTFQNIFEGFYFKKKQIHNLFSINQAVINIYHKIYQQIKHKLKNYNFYKLQQQAFKILQNNNNEMEQENVTFSEINSNKLCILDQQNKVQILQIFSGNDKINITKQTVYFIQYSNNIIILIDNKSKKLYTYQINMIPQEQIVDIYMQEVTYFNYYESSSYYVDQNKLYQFFGVNGEQFLDQIIIYDLLKQTKSIFKNSNSEKKIDLINFSVILISQQKNQEIFAIVGGHFQKNIRFQGNGFQVTLNIEEQKYQIISYQKNKKVDIPKEFDYPYLLNLDSKTYLTFEGISQFNNKPKIPRVKKAIITYGNGPTISYNNINFDNQDLFFNNINLFSSQQKNQKIIKSEKNEYQYEIQIIVSENVYDKISIGENLKYNDIKDFQGKPFIQFENINAQEDIKGLIHLGKANLFLTYVYSFYYQEQNIMISQNQSSKLKNNLETKYNLNCQLKIYQQIQKEQIENSNSNFQCLYKNWLENIYDQEIYIRKPENHIYLLGYKSKSKEIMYKRFTFEYQYSMDEKDIDYYDYNENICNDRFNEIIWVVRKNYNPDNTCDISVYDCELYNLQVIKEQMDDILTKIEINLRYKINNISPQEELLGVSVKESQNQLCVVTTQQLYMINIEEILKEKWKRIMNFQSNQWQKDELILQNQHQCLKINISVNSTQQFSVCYHDKNIYLFYTYCDFRKMEDNKTYQLSIRYFIINEQYQNLIQDFRGYTRTSKIEIDTEIIQAKINSLTPDKNNIGLNIVIMGSEQLVRVAMIINSINLNNHNENFIENRDQINKNDPKPQMIISNIDTHQKKQLIQMNQQYKLFL